LRVDGLATAVRTVKALALDMEKLSLDKVVDLMRFFPCLEKLHVMVAIISHLILVITSVGWIDCVFCVLVVESFLCLFSVKGIRGDKLLAP
jgi:hypothetical protein